MPGGRIICPKEIRTERLKKCMSCEHLKQPKNRCGKCGCFVSAKTIFLKSKCPIGKWGNEDEVKNNEEVN